MRSDKGVGPVTIWIAVLLSALLITSIAHAQTVYRVESTSTSQTRGQKITALTCTGGRWTGWVNVVSWRQITFEITNPTWTAATSIDMRCETSQVDSTANDAGEDLHVIVYTSAGGISTSETLTLRNSVVTTERWTWTIGLTPAPFVNCFFTCPAGTTDTVSVFVRTSTP